MIVGFIGLGLIGGSMAQATRAYTAHTILGRDQNKTIEQKALAGGVLDEILDEKSLSTCDLIILGMYPRESIKYMESQAKYMKKGACVVDLGGVKRTVCEAVRPLAAVHGFHFIGGHPMAGCEMSGYAAARSDLFSGASMILVPTEEIPRKTVAQVEAFFRALRFGQVILTDRETHDKRIAYTSQLVHILANAFIQSPAALHSQGFSAGSFRDFTRVATMNADMWTQLLMDNREFLLEEIDAFVGRLTTYKEALATEDEEGLRQLLQAGSERKAAIGELEARDRKGKRHSAGFLKEISYAKDRNKNRQSV